MEERKLPAWRKLLQDALSEADADKLPERIARAEVAIYRKIGSVKGKPSPSVERKDLENALESLRILKKRHLPGWDVAKRLTQVAVTPSSLPKIDP